MQTPEPQAAGFEKLRGWFHAARMFFRGLAFAWFFGQGLLDGRAPHSFWSLPLMLVGLACVALGSPRENEQKKERKEDAFGCLVGACFLVCYLAFFSFREQVWASPAAAVVTAAYVWALARSRHRSWPTAVAGCLLSGAAVLLVPWPNRQRLMLVFVGFGLAVALQGVWQIVRYAQAERPRPVPQLDPHPVSGEDIALRWLAWLVLGTVECVQILSPGLDQKIRARYRAEIDALSRLGFNYFCSYAGALSAFRLLLVFPALVTLMSLVMREVIWLGSDGKLGSCSPVMTAGDSSTYAEASALGVNFYTSFTDGTFLVTVNHESVNCEGPLMTRRWRVATVSEAWAWHRRSIEELEAAGRSVDRRIDFKTFADMNQRETKPR